MTICDSGHTEIVHDERKCPLCEALDDVERLKDDIKALEEERNDLQADIDRIVKDAEKEAI